VYGPALETIPGLTHPVGEGDEVSVPALGLSLRVLDIPGHTAGHVGYYAAPALFCGDTCLRRAAGGSSKARRRRCSTPCKSWQPCR
jgi:hydroxyacylglutathione hydrolase